MKKFISIILIISFISIAFPNVLFLEMIPAVAAAEPVISEDFESLDPGAYTGSVITSENKFAKVIESDGNKLVQVQTTDEKTDVFQISSRDFSAETMFSFELTNSSDSQGYVKTALRDSNGKVMDLVKIENGVVTYLNDIKKVTENIYGSQTLSITLTVDNKTGKIALYRDGIYKSGIDDFRTKPFFSSFNLQSCMFRFHAMQNVTYLVDNLLITTDNSPDCDIVAGESAIYYSEKSSSNGEKLCKISEPKNGHIVGRLNIVNNGKNPVSAVLALAHKSCGKLVNISLSETETLAEQSSKFISCSVLINNLKKGDTLELYLLDNISELRSLALKKTYTARNISDPLLSELRFLFENNENASHPGIMASDEEFNLIKYEKDAVPAEWKESIISQADKILTYNVNSHIWRNDTVVGDEILGISRRMISYMQTLGMAYQLTSDGDYPDKAYLFMERAASWGDWNPVHFLDVAEMTSAYAIAYDWMYDGFTDTEKLQIEGWIYNYGLVPGKAAYDGTGGEDNSGWWKDADHNWNIVCNGGLIVGAAVLADVYPDISFYIIDKAIDSLALALKNFAPDGAWVEGYAYIQAMYQVMSRAVSLLENAFGTDFGLMSYEGMDNSGDFIIQMVGNSKINNFHDATASVPNMPELMWLADIYNKPSYAAVRLNSIKDSGFTPSVTDIIFYDKSYASASPNLPLVDYFRGVEYVSLRSSWDSDALYLSYHGGKSIVNHGHADCGTFVLDALGERWACDIGPDSYNADGYFGEKRYLYYRTRTEGHNTIVISPESDPPSYPGQDMDADTKITEYDADKLTSRINLTSAYKSKASSVYRRFSIRENGTKAVIFDEIELLSESSNIYWFMHTQANIEIIDDTTAILSITNEDSGETKQLMVEFEVDAENFELTQEDAVSLRNDISVIQHSDNSKYKKLQLKITDTEIAYITVSFTPVI